jgi:hypothetical protein
MTRLQPNTEPAGDIWREAMARRGGREYTGGPVCWDPADCQGICRECRVPPEEARDRRRLHSLPPLP